MVRELSQIRLCHRAGRVQGLPGLLHGKPGVFLNRVKCLCHIFILSALALDAAGRHALNEELLAAQEYNHNWNQGAHGGRHDPCIAIRASVVVEAMTAIALADMLLCKEAYSG